MASVKPQQENKSQIVQVNASSANSIPTLRAEVVRLAEAVSILENQIEKLARQLSKK